MKKLIVTALAFSPVLAFAQTLQNTNTLLTSVGRLINTALPILVALAVLAFFWGLVKFLFNADNEEERGKGKGLMIWSIIALFVMVSVWGLVNFLANDLGVTNNNAPAINLPSVGNVQTR